MKHQYYTVVVTSPDGKHEQKSYPARGATNAWYIAMELNPGCQVKVLGLVPNSESSIE